MTSINNVTSSSTKTSGYTAKGFSGLVSGMETEEIVEAMTSDIQSKINKVKQEQQKNTWKQEAYRAVITSLTSFQDKFFSYASPTTNILSSALYNCSKKISQGANAAKINVTSTSNSNEAPYKVLGVKTMATRASYIGSCGFGGDTVSTGAISFADRDLTVLAGKSIDIKYDNQNYTVEIPESMNLSMATTDEEKNNQAQEIATYLNNALKQVSLEGTTGNLGERLEFNTSGTVLSLKTKSSTDSRSFEITGGDSGALTALGISVGDSGSATNPITGTGIVDPVQTKPFAEALTGKKLTFDLNGLKKTIEFTDTDATTIMDAYNNADVTGLTGSDIEAKRTSDGIAKMAEIINGKLDSSFGPGKITATNNAGKLDFKVSDSTSILKISSTTSDTMGDTGIFAMTNNSSNRLDVSKTLAELGIVSADDTKPDAEKIYKMNVNGQEFTFKGTDSLSTVINRINSNENAGVTINYLSTTNKFSITADEYGAMGKINIEDSTAGGNLAQTLFGTSATITANTKSGTDLEMSVQYEGDTTPVTIVRNSNSVNLDGISFNVEGEFGYKADGTLDTTTEAVSFKNESDTEDTIKVFKDMAEAYNKILDSVNELVSTKYNRKYPPLTDAQKDQMTKDEIDKWEAKAKEGILFGDSTLSQLASTLRFAFSSKVGDLGFAKDIGITVASSYSGNGKITIDETKLKEALTNDPEKVKAMFTASEEEAPNTANSNLSGGFATRVKSVFESYAKSTGAYKGKLVQLAGLKNNSTTDNNYIARQQKILDKKLDYLETLLKKRQDRYQSQFSHLETYISNMNAQSAWLASAFQ